MSSDILNSAATLEIPLQTRRLQLLGRSPASMVAPCRPVTCVGLAGVSAVTGSRLVTNEELLLGDPRQRTVADVVQRTGIVSRQWAADGETPLTLAVRACRDLLEREVLAISDFQAVICATSTPTCVTPSLACRVLSELSRAAPPLHVMAYDINAACSGYLYALRNAFELLQGNPQGRVLVVTAEVLSPLLDPHDFGTRCLFGDAASATIVSGRAHLDSAWARLYKPLVGSQPEDGALLSVPFVGQGHIRMQGRQVFERAVKSMLQILKDGCRASQCEVSGLDLAVPHQANQRILDAVGRHLPVPVFSNIRHLGNTASTSIPLALQDIRVQGRSRQKLGVCTFGGGFTCGSAILDVA